MLKIARNMTKCTFKNNKLCYKHKFYGICSFYILTPIMFLDVFYNSTTLLGTFSCTLESLKQKSIQRNSR